MGRRSSTLLLLWVLAGCTTRPWTAVAPPWNPGDLAPKEEARVTFAAGNSVRLINPRIVDSPDGPVLDALDAKGQLQTHAPDELQRIEVREYDPRRGRWKNALVFAGLAVVVGAAVAVWPPPCSRSASSAERRAVARRRGSSRTDVRALPDLR